MHYLGAGSFACRPLWKRGSTMDRQSSFLADQPKPGAGNRLAARLLPPLVTAFIVLILSLIGLILT